MPITIEMLSKIPKELARMIGLALCNIPYVNQKLPVATEAPQVITETPDGSCSSQIFAT